MCIEEILIIKNGTDSYGISTEDINQISRVPTLMPLPLRPSGTRGLCGVAGNIVSMVDVNLLLNMPEVDLEATKSRLLILSGHHSSNSLLVSEVYNTVNVNEKNIEYIDKKDDPVIAIYKYKDDLIQVLSLDILTSKINKVSIESQEVYTGKIKDNSEKEEDSTRFLIFAMADETFALNIDFLREIILADVQYTEIAGSPDDMLGLITLREELVAVIDLRLYYDFRSTKSEKNRILIANIDDKTIGLLVDEIIDIKSYANKDVEHMQDSFNKTKISGVIHDKDKLISFFDNEVIKNIFKQNKTYIESKSQDLTEDTSDIEDNVMEVIVFKISDKEYAFEVNTVAEIIDAIASTTVVYTEKGIDGIINIRGQIVTIVSLAQRLDVKMSIKKDSKIIVCNINGAGIGFIVDSISDILSIKSNQLQKQEEDKLFPYVLHLDDGNRLVLAMDIDKIVKMKG
ncbi:MAG: chemotaxis protein CheW [Sulfurimonas sp.]|nr:MAG: chemotaxis protein CheW [Sulfurimonas sp.]